MRRAPARRVPILMQHSLLAILRATGSGVAAEVQIQQRAPCRRTCASRRMTNFRPCCTSPRTATYIPSRRGDCANCHTTSANAVPLSARRRCFVRTHPGDGGRIVVHEKFNRDAIRVCARMSSAVVIIFTSRLSPQSPSNKLPAQTRALQFLQSNFVRSPFAARVKRPPSSLIKENHSC